MSKEFLKIKNGISFPGLATAPSDPQEGDIYFDTTLSKHRKYQSGVWSDLSAGGGGSLAVKDEGASVVASADTIDFVGSGVSVTQSPSGTARVQIDGGSGSGIDVDAIRALLDEDKAGQKALKPADGLHDNFDGKVQGGTLTNLVKSNRSLDYLGSNLSGNYLRQRTGSKNFNSVEGLAILSIPDYAPKNGVGKITSTTIVFAGDVSARYQVGKKIVISRHSAQDGVINKPFLTNTNGTPAFLTITASNYSSGPDETTLTVTNPGSLDLTMGATNVQYNSQLKVKPWDVAFQASSDTTGNLADSDITGMIGLDEVRIFGEQSFSVLSDSIAGTVFKMEANRSPNHQYVLVRLTEKISGSDDLWHFIGSKDFGKNGTWMYLGNWTRGYNNVNVETDNFSNSWGQQAQKNSIAIANNGKFFAAFVVSPGASYDRVDAVYGDLTDVTPSITGVPVNNVIGNNSLGNVADSGITHRGITLVADLTDLSIVTVHMMRVDNGRYRMAVYNNGGSTFKYAFNGPYGRYSTHSCMPFISGTSGNHIIRTVWTADGVAHPYCMVYRESDDANNEVIIESIGTGMAGSDQLGTKAYVAIDQSSFPKYYYTTNDIANTYTQPSWVKRNIMGGFAVTDATRDTNGQDTPDESNRKVSNDSAVIINPNNPNHVLITTSWRYAAENTCAIIYEINDDSDFVGTHIERSWTTYDDLGKTAPEDRRVAFAFTPNSRVRSLISSFRLKSDNAVTNYADNIPSNTYFLTCRLETAVNGYPTGTVVATALNQIDLSKVCRNGDDFITSFNFNTYNNPGQQVCAVFEHNLPQSPDVYLQIYFSNTGHSGGGDYQYSSSISGVWTMYVCGEWVHTAVEHYLPYISLTNEPEGPEYGQGESQIALIDQTRVRWTYREYNIHAEYVSRRWSGVSLQRTIVFSNSSSIPSIISTPTPVGYNENNYDRRVPFMVSLGDPQFAEYDRLGNLTGNMATNLSWLPMVYNDTLDHVSGTPVYVADPDFATGYCQEFTYNIDNRSFWRSGYGVMYGRNSFGIEADIKGAYNNPAGNVIFSHSHNGNGARWDLRIDGTSKTLRFKIENGGYEVRSNDPEPTSRHKVRMMRGLDGYVRLYHSTFANPDVFTECTYEPGYGPVRSPFVVGYSGAAMYNVIGGYSINTNEMFDGRISYVKHIIDVQDVVNPFVYTGVRDQRPLVSGINLGSNFVAKKTISSTDSALTGSAYGPYYDVVAAPYENNGSAVVDSNDVLVTFSKKFTSVGREMIYKILMSRPSIQDQSSVWQTFVRFFK
jgi:hypothetical protein